MMKKIKAGNTVGSLYFFPFISSYVNIEVNPLEIKNSITNISDIGFNIPRSKLLSKSK